MEKVISFFDQTEIDLLVNYADVVYNKHDESHKQVKNQLMSGVWEKTRYWAVETVKKLPEFDMSMKKIWSRKGWDDKKHVSKFKTYTWARIFKKGDAKKDIYFTVGIDSMLKSPLFKLDFQWKGKTTLSLDKKEILHSLIHNSEAHNYTFQPSLSKVSDWDTLVEETVEFISYFEDLYDEAIATAWGIEKRISRLTWNTKNWMEPSGRNGKSTYKGSFEWKNGFGHEEWLFDVEKKIEGYHYGFLEPIRKWQEAFTGKKYNVWLYSIDSATKKRFWIGKIRDCEVITSSEADKIVEIYKINGWYDEMHKQVISCGGKESSFLKSRSIDLFNIKYEIGNEFRLTPYVEITADHPVFQQSRYAFTYFTDGMEVENDDEFQFRLKDDHSASDSDSNTSKKYERQAKEVEMTFLHKKIAKILKELLLEKDKGSVSRENPAGYGHASIDVVLQRKEGCTFYEIKTYDNVRTSIRHAFGQILEYAYWPAHERADELVIVSHLPGDVDVGRYMKHIRTKFNIPVYYQHFDMDARLLGEKM